MEELLALLQGGLHSRESVQDILSVNQETAKHGIVFTPRQAAALMNARDRALHASGRLELYGGVMKKLILAFIGSPYFERDLQEETLCALIETFYLLKSETFDALSDDELIAAMRELFDGACRGCIELMQDAAYEQLVRRAHGAVHAGDEEGEEQNDGWGYDFNE